jgi:arylsulfatase A
MTTNPPNIIFILADDMGYGDVSGLNPDSAFQTPNLDRMIDKGMYFTDAHTSSSVCTPSRYSVLTGRYCWRTYLKKGVLSGLGNALIPSDRMTVASLTKQAGYDTACIGKWHVGWEWKPKPGCEDQVDLHPPRMEGGSWIDFTQPISKGPTSIGFDTFYGISGSLDMPPYVYVENDLAVEVPTEWASREEFMREGPRMKSIRANNVLEHLTNKSVDYIKTHDSDKPFFLYFPLTAPHTPIAPASEFVGLSGVNSYADFCMEVDTRVGQVFSALEESGQLDNTLVIFTTDNGASAGPSECESLEKDFNHFCSYKYRGYKSDIWDGGHRIPHLLHWPNGIKQGTVCHNRVGIFDFFATVADITGQSISDNAGEDSMSYAPAFTGGSVDESQRMGLIHHSISGKFAIRQGDWKLCRCSGSGGWTTPGDRDATEAGDPDMQLFNMKNDPGETSNLAKKFPHKVKELTELLHKAVISGRTTPGTRQSNDGPSKLNDWEQLNWLPEMPEQYVLDD